MTFYVAERSSCPSLEHLQGMSISLFGTIQAPSSPLPERINFDAFWLDCPFLSFFPSPTMALEPYADSLPQVTLLLTDKLTTTISSDDRDALASFVGIFSKVNVSFPFIALPFPLFSELSFHRTSTRPIPATFTQPSNERTSVSFIRFLAPSTVISLLPSAYTEIGTSPNAQTPYVAILLFLLLFY